MRVLSVTHGPLVRTELFGDWIRAAGHELVEWEITTEGVPPDGFDAVLVMGGDMNVGEEHLHPWLHDEYELLRGWVVAEMPLLGICLGAQTLAHARGATVGPAVEAQMGFLEVSLTDAGRRDRVLGALPERFEAFVGNAYAFEVPEGAVELATSRPQSQAYRLGERAWAVQFHPEVRPEQVVQWWHDEPHPPRPLGDLERDLAEKISGWQAHGRTLCLAFLDAARG
ncbi:MAG: type 1 glutamine amidotransferase [Actinomycetes bacterium]